MNVLATLKHPRRRRTMLAAWTMLTPNLLGFLIFTAGPVLFSLVMAFTDWNLTEHNRRTGEWPHFVAAENFVRLLCFQRNPLGPEVPHPLAWGLAGLLLCAFIPVLLYFCYRTNRAPFGQQNPPAYGTVLFAVACSCVLSVLSSAFRGALAAHPRLGLEWPALKLVAAALCLLPGVAQVRRLRADEARRLGRLAVLLTLLCVDLAVVGNLAGYVLSIWQPTNPLFFTYLWNTIFLMLAMPLGIAGSLVGALILIQRIEIGTWTQRIGLGVAILFGGLCFAVALRTVVPEVPELAGLLALIFVVGAAGVVGGTVVFRTLFYLPSISMGVATFILWQKLFDPEKGPVNAFFGWLFDTAVFDRVEACVRWWVPQLGASWHLTSPDWLLSVTWAKPAIMIMGLWAALGSNNMLLYLAGLSNIPQELYEAASIDGASGWQKFWHVTWPQLAPTTFFIFVMGTIGGLQGGFEQARVMTNGGPARSTTTLSYFLYIEAFENFDLGYASAVAWTLFVVIFILTMINWRFGSEVVSEYQ
ncbi:MAG: hypothetical protein COZ06_07825 [Armatimonadetes bacterium CG_4_10_14_3_um_filter_66_18]|nr:MAG: hypothetical protein COZ57_24315 [Armatimonadetes bacterium CG_4_8_14_3_um_filter_66_20]PIY50725.1 MAG: hypothetical protein COZ06_07825 [Armatimonadetes bacterium CG_4_10_14_3_um_filter_66_18]PIZ35691.1 MAG: hypothetical protein COY42_26360 [Armatimonadetes bacterium CG_4_10_14_0_8_um_filter_66_14]PJB73829.1 MAG: hypothetical protein CO096_05000 [Armatimonadetes bacterium CG_4_9_14_3_um_filter_66_14]